MRAVESHIEKERLRPILFNKGRSTFLILHSVALIRVVSLKDGFASNQSWHCSDSSRVHIIVKATLPGAFSPVRDATYRRSPFGNRQLFDPFGNSRHIPRDRSSLSPCHGAGILNPPSSPTLEGTHCGAWSSQTSSAPHRRPTCPSPCLYIRIDAMDAKVRITMIIGEDENDVRRTDSAARP